MRPQTVELLMIESVATIVIGVSSAVLFAYWFRYTCLLVLSARTAHDYAFQFATENGLAITQIQDQLRQADPDLLRLHQMLDRDYAVIQQIVAAGSLSGMGIETRILALNYRIDRICYQVMSRVSQNSARGVLEEMSSIVAHFANALGEAATSPSAA
jgi:hypothetical protein